MKRTSNILAVLVLGLTAGTAHATESPAVTATQLVGKTLSAVAFIQRSPGMPGAGELARIMMQAYLGPDGRALVRSWDVQHDAYTVPAERRWSLNGSTFCVDVPLAGSRPVCADIHVWGPRIAGVGTRPYAMLDGDLQPGNIIGGR